MCLSGTMIDTTTHRMMDTPESQLHQQRHDHPISVPMKGEKYALRPRTIIKRLQQERTRHEVPRRPSRCKQRPPPLSKYRRKTANARERHRMKQINNAFESLRKILPDAMEVQPSSSSSMTKITTLRLAVNYIRALSDVLEDGDVADLCTLETSLQHSLQNSLQHSMQMPLRETLLPEGSLVTFQYHEQMTHFTQQCVTQMPRLLDCCSSTSSFTSLTSPMPSKSRESLGIASDLEELLSEDSRLLEESLHVFHDFPALADPFEGFL
ncbi:neurogenic differentiation factor 6-like [Homarus americanus]|uniref:neurogenic differentiation factor 6-like n=1 Tax=Homarus americanus TaxID=6706 RepID=UPI001C48B4B7|nr:neurogenic differentiation factor 6-like [Homarus americanus]